MEDGVERLGFDFLEGIIWASGVEFWEEMRNSEKWLNIHLVVNMLVIFHISISDKAAVSVSHKDYKYFSCILLYCRQ